MIHATTYADTNPIHSRKKSFHDTKRTDIRSHKTSLSSLFTCSSRQADKHNISKQKANNEEAKQSYGSLKSREVFYREPQNGKSSCDSSSNLHRATLWHSQTGRKSRLQSIQDSLRQSFRFRKDHNSRDFSHVTYGRTQQAELCLARCQKSRTQKIQKIQILIYNHLVVNLFNTFLWKDESHTSKRRGVRGRNVKHSQVNNTDRERRRHIVHRRSKVPSIWGLFR